ncbi:MAG: EAL domain-containing protein [Chitinivorax sp.]
MTGVPHFSPLRARLAAVVLVVQVILVGVLALNMSQSWDQVARSSLEKRLQELNLLLNAALAPTLVTQDYSSAYDLMESIRSDEQIDYLVLYDRNGKVVVSSGWEAGQPTPPADRIDQFRRLDDTFHARTILRLESIKYGALHYGLTTRSLGESLRGMYWQTLAIALASVAICTAVLLWLGFRVTRDLRKLSLAATAIANGETGVRANVRRNDEIGVLARDFDAMASKLEQQMQELRASESNFHAIADYTYGVEMWLSPTGKLLWVNSSAERVFGYSAAECLAMPDFPRPLIGNDEADDFYTRIRGALNGSSEHDIEFRGLRRDGSEYWGVISWVPIYAPDGTHLGIRASVRDNSDYHETQAVLSQAVDELRRAQAMQQCYLQQAEQEKARLGALLSAISVGILFVDQDEYVVYCNPAFRQQWQIADSTAQLGTKFDTLLQAAGNLPEICLLQGDAQPGAGFALDTSLREYDMRDGRVIKQHSHTVLDDNGREIGSVWLFEDVTESRRAAERLVFLAERDSLTGLFNRHRFQEELARMLFDADRHQTNVALLFFDLDEFKYINDTFGHGAGDNMLVRVAQEISGQIRRNEILCRLGGDEFALLVPGAIEAEMGVLAERLVRAVEQITFAYEGQSLRLGTSVGVALFPQHASNGEELIANADMAMYQAKAAGKNTARIYRPDQNLSREMVDRWSWKERIQHALDNNLLLLYFQGIYHASDRRLSHLEVLVRMRDSQEPDKIVPPGQFIPIAEKTGKIIEIDRWIIHESIKLLATSSHIPSLSINISGRSFDEPALPGYIAGLLQQYEVKPQRLYVEVTETAAVSDMRDAQRFIEALRSTGCKVCLDDFGTGFSSFTYLKHLKADVLKIDGMFVRDLLKDHESQIFVRGMVTMAHSMGKQTVAEFVENEETLQMLKEFGVDMVQGYHLDRPRADHPALYGQASLEGF